MIELHNIGVVTNGVQRAVATWYGPPQGPGSGGACGFANDWNCIALRKLGRIEVEFARVPCRYATKMTFKVDGGSNPNYFACAIEYVPEDGAIKSVELKPSNSVNWLPMQKIIWSYLENKY
ncbi:hypothetical protein Leryth_007887 [Lithospermum erythrorhizon]|nr:hypothetical protein Leryth_007887 [Lithospermum erythrorhizon]